MLPLVQQRVGLVEQLVDRAPAGARDRLVGGDDQALDPSLVVERLQRHDHLHRRAVRVGDDPAVLGERLGVDLADDERNVVLHAPARGVVDHDCARIREPGCPLAGGGAAGGEQREVEALDRLVVQALHDQAALELAPDRARGGERDDLARRERALTQQCQHQRADLSGGADDGDSISLAHAVRVPRRTCSDPRSRRSLGKRGKDAESVACYAREQPRTPHSRRPAGA